MNIFAAIDLETSGLAPGWHEVLEIAIVPLTQDFTIDTNVTEFSCRIRAEHLDRIDPKAVAVNNLNPAEGKPLQEVEADLISWAEENGISAITPVYTPQITANRISLGHVIFSFPNSFFIRISK